MVANGIKAQSQEKVQNSRQLKSLLVLQPGAKKLSDSKIIVFSSIV